MDKVICDTCGIESCEETRLLFEMTGTCFKVEPHRGTYKCSPKCLINEEIANLRFIIARHKQMSKVMHCKYCGKPFETHPAVGDQLWIGHTDLSGRTYECDPVCEPHKQKIDDEVAERDALRRMGFIPQSIIAEREALRNALYEPALRIYCALIAGGGGAGSGPGLGQAWTFADLFMRESAEFVSREVPYESVHDTSADVAEHNRKFAENHPSEISPDETIPLSRKPYVKPHITELSEEQVIELRLVDLNKAGEGHDAGGVFDIDTVAIKSGYCCDAGRNLYTAGRLAATDRCPICCSQIRPSAAP